MNRDLVPKFGAVEHWAKIEVPAMSDAELAAARARLAKRYPVEKFAAARRRLDPKNILGNETVDALFPSTPAST